jgi:two-component system sensor histidine kinase UhpB
MPEFHHRLRRRTRLDRPSLLKQILTVNAALTAATVLAVTIVARSALQSDVGTTRLDLLVAATLATVLVNGFVLRRRFEPLEQLIDAMERIDSSQGVGRPVLPAGETDEVARVHHAFGQMLDRLDDERNRTAGAVLRAQEAERTRIARDLHDEANQALTGVLLRLQATAERAPRDLQAELRETREAVAQAMNELLQLARDLRPTALDDLGLAAALRTKVSEFAKHTGVRADLDLPPGIDDLGADEQIVIYRVVQESLSNVAQHAEAGHVRVAVERGSRGMTASVTDDGRGFEAGAGQGLGLAGMRERAVLVGGSLAVHTSPGGGTSIELHLEDST